MATEVQTQVLAEDQALGEILRCLPDAYHPLWIYLFGSKARGDAGPDSDYDLLLVVPDDAPPERRRSRLAYETLWHLGARAAVDALVCTRSYFDARRHLRHRCPEPFSTKDGCSMRHDPARIADTAGRLRKAKTLQT